MFPEAFLAQKSMIGDSAALAGTITKAMQVTRTPITGIRTLALMVIKTTCTPFHNQSADRV
jgi:hypothetical protein